MKKLPAAVLLCAVLFVLASFSVRADGGFVFAKSDDGGSYILTSYNGGAAEAVIPGEYNGLPVSKIAANAFSGSVSTYKIVIPASVTEIEPGAFDGMASLHEFEAAGNYTAVGGALFTKDRKTLVRYPQALEGKYTVPDGTTVGDRAFTGSALSYVDAKGVSSIGDHAFYLSDIKKIDLSAKLSFIGAHAFEKSALVTVTVPGGTSVGGYAFSNCSSLEYADLKNAEITGDGVFYGDISLLAVSYPARMTEVFDLTFAGCLSLVTAPTGEKTERIGEKAFFGCASLEYASCGGASYNDGSFGLCSVIPDDKSYVKVPSTPDAITLAVGRSYRLFNGGEYDVFTSSHIVRSDNGVITALYEGEAFVYVVSRRGGDCKAVRVTVSDGEGVIESDHPYDTGRQSFSYTVSGSPKRIAVTFSSSDMLTESDSITVYDKNGNSYGTFTGGRLAGKTLFLDGDRIRIELTSVTGGSYGFRVVSAVPADSLTKIKTISVSPSVSINEGEEYALSPVISPSGAFPSELLYVSSDSSVAEVSADGTVRGVGGGAAVITVYSSFYGVSAECAVTVNGRDKGDFEYEIRENKAFITGYNGFDRNCVIPDTVDGYTVYGIADGAFSYGNIKSVFIPSTVCVIESRAFDGCSSLTAFDVAEDNPAYSSSGSALYDKDKTTLIKAAGGVKGVFEVGYAVNIMPGAFSYCFGIEEIVLPAGLKNVSGAAFRYCTALKRITADGENYLSVDGVLYTSDSKTLVSFPADMNVHTYTVIPQAENIGEYAFSGASALVGLVIPENVRAIDGKALCEAFSLSDVKVNTNNRFYSVKDGCLLENGALKFVPKTIRGVFTVPESVGEILPFALYNCSLISEVVFPSRIVSVGEYAFGNCTKLFDLFLPESVKKSGYDAFENDTAMTVYIPENTTVMYLSSCRAAVAKGSPAHIYCEENGIPYEFSYRASYGLYTVYSPVKGELRVVLDKDPVYLSKAEPAAGQRVKTFELYLSADGVQLPLGENIFFREKTSSDRYFITDGGLTTITENAACRYLLKSLHIIELTDKTFTEKISVRKPPDKTEYQRYEPLDTTGLELYHINENGLTEIVNADYVAEADMSGEGVVTVTVSYEDLTAVFDIYIVPARLTGSVSITGDPRYNSELKADASGVSPEGVTLGYKWYKNGVLIPGASSDKYKPAAEDIGAEITVRVKAVSGVEGELTSGAVTVGKAKAAIPPRPEVKSYDTSSITLTPVDGCEYRLSASGDFSDSNVFRKLKPDTTYILCQRYKETETTEASAISSISFLLPAPQKIRSDVYFLNTANGAASLVGPKTTADEFLKNFKDPENLAVYKNGAKLSGSDFVGTGCEVRLEIDGEVYDKYTVIITGDVNGDGKITITDYLQIKERILNGTQTTTEKEYASDVNGDGKVTITDYLRLKYCIQNGVSPEQNRY